MGGRSGKCDSNMTTKIYTSEGEVIDGGMRCCGYRSSSNIMAIRQTKEM